MLTNDAQGLFRADNHGWFFGWTNGTLFQARASAMEPEQLSGLLHECSATAQGQGQVQGQGQGQCLFRATQNSSLAHRAARQWLKAFC
jgi:hypothetical protein